MAKQSFPGQSKFSARTRKEHKCSCGDTFYHKSRLDQHARFCQKKTSEEQESSSASKRQKTNNASVMPIDLDNMVLCEIDDHDHERSDEEEEEEEERATEDDEFTEPTNEQQQQQQQQQQQEEIINDNNDEPFLVRSEFFPFKDEVHLLMHQFYYRYGSDISQTLMTDIVNLIKDIVNAIKRNPNAHVPAPSLIFDYDDTRRTKNQIPAVKQTRHEVKIRKNVNGSTVEEVKAYYMIPPSEILRLLVANPLISDSLTKLPDFTVGELTDSYQSMKWRTHESFQHPMVSLPIGSSTQDVWIGDVVALGGFRMVVDKFYTVDRPDNVIVAGYFVTESPSGYLLNAPPSLVPVKADQITAVVVSQLNPVPLFVDVRVAPQGSHLFAQCIDVINKLIRPNPLKRPSPCNSPRKFMLVKVVPLNLFTDDMSGNRTKKHNKFDSWSMVPAALPLSQRHAIENTSFICTDHELSAMQMLPAIVSDLLLLENCVEMVLPSGEPVVVTAPLQFITADNARHAEIASCRSAMSLMPCRKCTWFSKATPKKDGSDFYRCSPRSEAVVEEMYNRFLSTGDESSLLDVNKGYKLVGGQSLVALKSFDVMQDCPVELLHCVMLGVGKALVSALLKVHLLPDEVGALQAELFSYASKSFSRKLRSSLRLHGSFLGRDYKILLQQIPILLSILMHSGAVRSNDTGLKSIKRCFITLGNFISLVYIGKIRLNYQLYKDKVAFAYDQFRLAVLRYDAYEASIGRSSRLYHTSKMHILSHIREDIDRFGSAIYFETEKGEQFNKFIRESLFRTNRHNPSKDVAVAFGKRLISRHILTGGSWVHNGSTSVVKASSGVIECKPSFKNNRDFADNDDVQLVIKAEMTGIFKNKYGNLFIGKVVRLHEDDKFTVVEYGLLCVCDQSIKTRFVPLQNNENPSASVYWTCKKDEYDNTHLVAFESSTCKLKLDEHSLIETLDLSRRYRDGQVLINNSKFGTFWWALSHRSE